jgi:2-polyprenyl-3-methyl-5-hydroxy-6-metoxy-1,4-benzoquinol methylase
MSDFETVSCLFGHETEQVLLFEHPDWWFELEGNFAWQKCSQCGLLYLSPRPTQTKINDYYLSNYAAYRPAIDDEKSSIMRWKRRRNLKGSIDVIKHHHPTPGRVLDVGCATGNYLAELHNLGWEVTGVELNDEAATYAQQRFGINIFIGDLLESQFPENHFDVVTLWDVLEHTFDPLAIMNEIKRILKPNGLVAFSIPNPKSTWAKRFGAAWIGYDSPRHLYLFHNKSLALLLAQSGFDLVEQSHFLETYHTWVASFHTWLNREMDNNRRRRWLQKIAYLPVFAPLSSPYFHWLNHHDKGSILTVIAQAVTEK